MAVNISNLGSAVRPLTADQRRRMELLQGIDQGNIRALDALAHASLPAAETAPTAQRNSGAAGQGLGDKPSGGTTTTTWATPGGGGTTKSSSFTSTYSGGVTEPWTGTMPAIDPFSYGDAPTYGGSQYDDRRDRLLDQLEGSSFSYDPNTDPVWQAYQKQYRREGDRATANALAQASSLSGGRASTAAMTAASQAGDYYASQLSDRLPQMYQDAYNRYLAEYERQLGLADTFNSLGQQDYSRYKDTLNQFNTDRNFAYGVYSDDANRQMEQYGAKYKEYLDEMDRRAGERDWEYGVAQDEKNWARQAWLDQYGMDQDAETRARQAWLDSMTGEQYQTQRWESAMAFLRENGFVTGEYADILGVPAGTTLTQYYQMIGIDPATLGLGVTATTGTSGYVGGTGGNPSPAPEAAGPETEGPADDGYTYSGTHENGLKKTVGYDQALVDTRAVLNNEKGTDAHKESVVLRYLRGLVSRSVITEYESQMIYALLGFGTPAFGKSSAGNTRISVGPNNVQMIQ